MPVMPPCEIFKQHPDIHHYTPSKHTMFNTHVWCYWQLIMMIGWFLFTPSNTWHNFNMWWDVMETRFVNNFLSIFLFFVPACGSVKSIYPKSKSPLPAVKVCFKHSNFFKVNGPNPLPRTMNLTAGLWKL